MANFLDAVSVSALAGVGPLICVGAASLKEIRLKFMLSSAGITQAQVLRVCSQPSFRFERIEGSCKAGLGHP